MTLKEDTCIDLNLALVAYGDTQPRKRKEETHLFVVAGLALMLEVVEYCRVRVCVSVAGFRLSHPRHLVGGRRADVQNRPPSHVRVPRRQ